jgi:hypothetical protein
MTGALPIPSPSLSTTSLIMSDSDSERDDEITMGGYTDLPPEERPGRTGYTPHSQQQGAYTVSYAPGAGGVTGSHSVNYAKPVNPSYTATPQFGSAMGGPTRSVTNTSSYSQPNSDLKYAELPDQFRYSRTPQIAKPQKFEIEPKKKKKDKKDKATLDWEAMPPPPLPGNNGYDRGNDAYDGYNIMTVEPGKKKAAISAPSYPGPGAPPPPPAPRDFDSFDGHAPYPTGPSMFPTVHAPPPPPAPLEYDTGPRSSRNSEKLSYLDGATVREIAPDGKSSSPPGRSRTKSQSSHLSVSGLRPDVRAPSPNGDVRRRLDRLSVSGDRPDFQGVGGGMPPPSPLLEPYRGTWQAMGGMPSPMMHPIDAEYEDYSFDELEPLSPRRSNTSMRIPSGERDVKVVRVDPKKGSRRRSISSKRSDSPKKKKDKPKKTVSMYEAERDAKEIARELVRAEPDVRVLTEILPLLSHDEMVELQMAYKRVVKQNGQGVKLSNHIKTKVPRGMFNTLAYVTALGRWESEGYWANYWYQGDTSKRELLIESLMGRTNTEIKMIKESFKDKRYANSLEKCMDKELRKDKFRTAVLMALEENRQDESDVWPKEYVQRDVDTWAKSLRTREGGETAMLEICVRRSDKHLRECLRLFEKQEGFNFAKEVLKRSSNLVVSCHSPTIKLSTHISIGRSNRSYFEWRY